MNIGNLIFCLSSFNTVQIEEIVHFCLQWKTSDCFFLDLIIYLIVCYDHSIFIHSLFLLIILLLIFFTSHYFLGAAFHFSVVDGYKSFSPLRRSFFLYRATNVVLFCSLHVYRGIHKMYLCTKWYTRCAYIQNGTQDHHFLAMCMYILCSEWYTQVYTTQVCVWDIPILCRICGIDLLHIMHLCRYRT